MIKQVPAQALKAGMYIHDLNCDWMSHPFVRTRFRLSADEQIETILKAGINEVMIDTSKGMDVSDAPTIDEVREQIFDEVRAVTAAAPPVARVTVAEELERAARIRSDATRVVKHVMEDVRLGRAVEMERMVPLVESITGSIMRNSGALVSMLSIKTADEYTFEHCVSVCTLMVAFARSLGLDAESSRQAGLGGLVHDVGKMKTPSEVLNKAGRFTDAEFAIMKRHPEDGHAILRETPGIGETPLAITLAHHERMDGSGYPYKLGPENIPQMVRMASIVDVYDAITSDRCYHKGMSPTEALGKIFEWSKFHFDPHLVQAFTRCIGIYPVGTLVRLESGRLGVVTEQHEGNLLTPVVKVFYSTRGMGYITPEAIDLSKKMGAGGADRIVNHESAQKWQVDPKRFM
ncbi:MAG: HD-GYP domain-containing protein [Betaproteobacteria bacterium]|nr:HD-GYP domain-containing protein [Betaproteobacteria bacterium]